MIIGVTGSIVSGKGTFAKVIAKEGFELFTFGGEVREYIEEDLLRRGPNDREHQQYWGDRARILHGAGFWANRIMEKVQGDSVVDGFRYPDQVDIFIRNFGDNFHLVAVDAFPWIRFRFCQSRCRAGDPQTYEDFMGADQRDMKGYLEGNGQNTRGCLNMAIKRVYNHGGIDGLKESALNFLRAARHSC